MIIDRLTRLYSERLGVLAGFQLQAALGRFGLGQLEDAQPVSGGLFGQNLFLSSTTGEYVLRGKPHYDWQFPAERFFANLIHERTEVPVPWPYLLDESGDIFGWPYVLMPRMPGESLPDFGAADTLTPADGLGIARAMGETLARLHAVTWEHCGEYDLSLSTIRPIDTSYRAWITGKVEGRVRRCLSEGSISEADAAWCRELMGANADALDVSFPPTLVHHDYKRGNLTVQRVDETWRVSGVFDLMECYFGDGEEDLVRTIFDIGPHQPERSRAFVAAYTAGRPLRDGYRERFVLNMLRDALLIWGHDHRRGRPRAPGRTFREWAEPYITMDALGYSGQTPVNHSRGKRA